ncbi:MAG: DNA translocase FtsK 4TM domain-containing protein [Syntrophobacteraceae bacterium]|nr:DNA translocase FtsK 4TM domain-containing protein [Syntrophobacteraceae bacterium]
MSEKKHEIWALIVLTISLLVLFSILSYSSEDPTFFNPSIHFTANLVGRFGANLAWPLIAFFGIGAYGVAITGLWTSLHLFKGSSLEGLWPRLLGIGLLVLSIMSLSALHWPTIPLFGQRFQPGGKVGSLLAGFLDARLSAVGSHIVLMGTLLIALLLATPLTIKAAFRQISTAGAHALRWLAAEARVEDDSAQPLPETAEAPPRRAKKKETVSAPLVQAELFPKKQARKEAALPAALEVAPGQYVIPELTLLDIYETENVKPDWKKLEQNGAVLAEKLADFGVQGKVVGINPGPVITMYEYAPAPGIKISRIVTLADDLSMALRAMSIRVVAPIPGKGAVGIEIPNLKRELVTVRAVLETESFSSSGALSIALGKDIAGSPVAANLARMPHLLIAGATGTGKSVCINTLLSSLLFKNSPEDLRLLLIDPKRIELSSYEGIPHLIHPVVTDAKMATRALRWAVEEMELRYKLLADKNVRNIESYNRTLVRERPRERKEAESEPEAVSDTGLHHCKLPYVVIIIDELADLMMVASREVEESITRLAQMARAAGIHLILATQRPSVDVLTGIIKANIPTRISFQVSSKIDSRTILDGSGAEALLGAGDMLFLPPGAAKLQRIHGAFVSDAEIERLTEHWRAQKLLEDPLKDRIDLREEGTAAEIAEEELDEKYEEAVQLVVETRQASISMLQRRLRVGYNRAARMIEVMEHQGIVSPSDGIKPREVLGRRLS